MCCFCVLVFTCCTRKLHMLKAVCGCGGEARITSDEGSMHTLSLFSETLNTSALGNARGGMTMNPFKTLSKMYARRGTQTHRPLVPRCVQNCARTNAHGSLKDLRRDRCTKRSTFCVASRSESSRMALFPSWCEPRNFKIPP